MQASLSLCGDGEKVKVCRAVNSFVTTTGTKGESFKKIKVVDTMDMIKDDIRLTAPGLLHRKIC